ncbi:MAG: hypothetical protein AMS24_04010 [Chlamydiae bacterium SM23_39]|nr:MAG: hypothetical protein AMS24_04010 [Chlamydiae bacterium SM23_39]
METFSIGYVILSYQRALLDAVTPELRAVVVDIDKDTKILYSRFYYDGDVPEETIDLWSCVETEASASLGPDCRVDGNIERLDYPQKIPCHGHLAYLRKEENLCVDNSQLKTPIFTYKDLKQLLKKSKQKHQQKYQEIINFEEFIGYSINRETGEKIKTSWGIIHQLKDKMHIIPAFPGRIKDLRDKYVIAYALLSAQNALLGRVTPELRSVVVDFCEEKKLLYIHMYYDGKSSKEHLDMWESVILETWADLGHECLIDKGIKRLDFPKEELFRGRYAYLRKERT